MTDVVDLLRMPHGRLTRAMREDAALEILRLRNIASHAIKERDACHRDVLMRAAIEAESECAPLDETGDFYSGFCDGVAAAAAAVRRLVSS